MEAATVTLLCFGLSIAASVQAVIAGFPAPIGSFSDASLVWLVVTEVVLGMAAILFLSLRGYPVASLLPAPTLRGTAAGVGLYGAAWIVGALVAMPFSGGPGEQPIARMVQAATPTLPVVVVMALVNGSFEEVFLLGVLLRGLRTHGRSFALGVMLLVRLLCHLYQGPWGAAYVLGIGLVFGLAYLRWQVLWPLVFAHVLWDIVPFVLR